MQRLKHPDPRIQRIIKNFTKDKEDEKDYITSVTDYYRM
jgi:hypothetical protein